MMASTFESLNAMKAAVNAAAATGGPVQLPGAEPAEATATPSIEVAVAELAAATEPAAAAETVAAADPVVDLAPKPVAMAMAAPSAPTTRTVKVIPIAPSGLPQTAAATAAANAAQPDTQPAPTSQLPSRVSMRLPSPPRPTAFRRRRGR